MFYIFIRTLKNTVHMNWFVSFETTTIILLSIGRGLALKCDFLHVEILLNISCCIRIIEKHSWLSRLLVIRRHLSIVSCRTNVTSSSPGLHPTLFIGTVHIPCSVSIRCLTIIRLLPSPLVLRRRVEHKKQSSHFFKFFKISIFRWTQHQLL